MSDCGPAGQLLPVAVWRVVTNLGTIIIMGHSSLIVPPVSRPPPSLTYFNSAASVMSWAGCHEGHLELGILNIEYWKLFRKVTVGILNVM